MFKTWLSHNTVLEFAPEEIIVEEKLKDSPLKTPFPFGIKTANRDSAQNFGLWALDHTNACQTSSAFIKEMEYSGSKAMRIHAFGFVSVASFSHILRNLRACRFGNRNLSLDIHLLHDFNEMTLLNASVNRFQWFLGSKSISTFDDEEQNWIFKLPYKNEEALLFLNDDSESLGFGRYFYYWLSLLVNATSDPQVLGVNLSRDFWVLNSVANQTNASPLLMHQLMHSKAFLIFPYRWEQFLKWLKTSGGSKSCFPVKSGFKNSSGKSHDGLIRLLNRFAVSEGLFFIHTNPQEMKPLVGTEHTGEQVLLNSISPSDINFHEMQIPIFDWKSRRLLQRDKKSVMFRKTLFAHHKSPCGPI